MKIIVCAKQIRHTYARSGNDPESHYICPEDGIYRVNPHDEAALELALRLKEANAQACVALLTLGPIVAEDQIRRCMATGADDLYQITYRQNASEDPDPPDRDPPDCDPLDQPDAWVKSDLFARAVRDLQGDLVLCGKESIDKGSGQVAALVAHRLQRPFVSAITDLSIAESSDRLQVHRNAGRGIREIVECRLPAVLSVNLGPDLRLPKFALRHRAEAYAPKQLEYGEDIDAPKIVCTNRFQPRPRPKIVPPPDSRLHAYDRIMQLLTGSKMEKKGSILTGSPESQVDGIIAFLKQNGFLGSEHAD